MGGLERPDPRAEPSEKGHVLGETAEERLHQVDVGLDEARHHDASGNVDDLGVGRRCGLADTTDACAAHEKVPSHRARRIAERQQRASTEQNAHGWYARSRRAVASTRVPSTTSSAAVASSGQCDRPPMLGTNSIPTLAAAARTCAS